MQKTCLAVHDLSCCGRSSLTVALPVLSACGIHTTVLPTALLSTHTGEFTGYTCLDLTEEMAGIEKHFERLDLQFDGLYTGFLGNAGQISLVARVLKRFRRSDTLALVDPVLADEGRLYATCDMALAEGMRELCAQADVITPNLTEAALLLGLPYEAEPEEGRVNTLLELLASRFGCGQVVITGVRQGEVTGAAGFCARDGSFCFAGAPHLPHTFYGTGDVFASGLLGALMQGLRMPEALRLAVDFTYDGMKHTLENGLPLRYGVSFEQALPLLWKGLQLNA